MKTLLFFFLLYLPLSLATDPITSDCKCNDIKLWGKVRFVEYGEDFRVRVVECGEDLTVAISNGPTRCGEWDTVSIGEDFRVRLVDCFEDFSIRYSPFPYLPKR